MGINPSSGYGGYQSFIDSRQQLLQQTQDPAARAQYQAEIDQVQAMINGSPPQANIPDSTPPAPPPSSGPNNPPTGGSGDNYTGYSSYHIYDGVPGTSTASGLDPAAFGMKVTALRSDLVDAYVKAHGVPPWGKKALVTNTATGASVTVTIIDRSNDYSNNGGNRYLDMSQQAFSAIGNPAAGSIPVKFTIL